MAKLNVTYPAVDVMVNGVAYRKVDRKAQAGDILKALHGFVDITAGAFYGPVYEDRDGELTVRDDVNEEHNTFTIRGQREVYAPVISEVPAETPTSPSGQITYNGAQYRKVDRSARESDVVVFTEETDYITEGVPYAVTRIDGAGDAHVDDNDGDDLDTCGKEFDVYEKVTAEVAQTHGQPSVEYREVKRKADVGERIKIVSAVSLSQAYANGDLMTVKERQDSEPHGVWTHETRVFVYDREYVVLEPVASAVTSEPKRLTVGDFAKVIGPNDNYNNYEIGTVVQIAEDWKRGFNTYTRAKKADGQLGDYIREYQLELATEAEFLAQRKPAEPARLKVGDFAKVIADQTTDNSGPISSGARVGDIVEVVEDDRSFIPYRVLTIAGYLVGDENWAKTYALAPATPEEVAEARAAAKRKIAIGPFADGGFAVVADASKSECLTSGISTGDYVKVAVTEVRGPYALEIAKPDERSANSFCDADALRQITGAEYNAAVAPEPAFSVGDKIRITRNQCNWPVGTIAIVTEVLARPNHDSGTVRARALEATYLADGNCFELLTAEEATAIEKEAQETARWAKIGRKVGEFKRGDIVQGTGMHTQKLEIGTVKDVGTGLIGVDVPSYGYSAMYTSGVTLIVPVEQRFDNVA